MNHESEQRYTEEADRLSANRNETANKCNAHPEGMEPPACQRNGLSEGKAPQAIGNDPGITQPPVFDLLQRVKTDAEKAEKVDCRLLHCPYYQVLKRKDKFIRRAYPLCTGLNVLIPTEKHIPNTERELHEVPIFPPYACPVRQHLRIKGIEKLYSITP